MKKVQRPKRRGPYTGDLGDLYKDKDNLSQLPIKKVTDRARDPGLNLEDYLDSYREQTADEELEVFNPRIREKYTTLRVGSPEFH